VGTPSYDQLFEDNRHWVGDELAGDPDHFERLAAGQHPKYLFIGCFESRVNANVMVGIRSGEMFVHRNMANLEVRTDMNLMSVLQFAVEALDVEHVIVCGHYGCGGVATAVDGSPPRADRQVTAHDQGRLPDLSRGTRCDRRSRTAPPAPRRAERP